MKNIEFFNQFVPKKEIIVPNKAVLSYSRVSSKEQYETNSSIQRQIAANEEYAKINGYSLTENFGGTYESAKSDFTRKEFMVLIDRVKKSRLKPFAIIVYKMSRFSRSGGNAIGLVNHLVEEMGVHLIESASGLNTMSERGKVAIYESLFHAYKENLERKEIIIPNMKAFLKKGYRFGQSPLGYDHYGPRVKNENLFSRIQKILINKQGKILKEAWQWKLTGNYSDAQILQKLKARGLRISKQKLSVIWRNPFYCGILINSLSEEAIQGKWEPLITQEHFMKVQKIIEGNPSGYQHNKQEELRPLSRSLKCSICNNFMVGYEVRKKGLHYYRCLKCNGVSLTAFGSSRKKNAEQLLKDLLNNFQIPHSLFPLIHLQLEKIFVHFNSDNAEADKMLKSKLSELQRSLKNLKIRRGLSEIDQEIYTITSDHLLEEINNLNKEIDNEIPKVSNWEFLLSSSLEKLQNLNEMWGSSNLEGKRILQKTLFPRGIIFDAKKHEYLTTDSNSFLSLIGSLTTDYIETRNATFPKLEEKSRSV